MLPAARRIMRIGGLTAVLVGLALCAVLQQEIRGLIGQDGPRPDVRLLRVDRDPPSPAAPSPGATPSSLATPSSAASRTSTHRH
ncbi:hypothetical protein Pth03_70670 [Planotetraspora thailandica]|uniref:Uncharacterized protein n=1 Tax=Planotetraspora thailandica TaxID=487172 RepID=A0A8J4DDP7_9ACTN|nr:hypothetical protein Pth03_70670 [Planotetraspora thailandica]